MDNEFAYLDELSLEQMQAFKAGQPVFDDSRDRLDSGSGFLEEGFSGAPGLRERQQRGLYTIVAEGDSWFDLPLKADLIDCLRRMGHNIFSQAKAGDTLENMVYGSSVTRSYGPLPSGMSQVLPVLEEQQTPVFLFSGGGNDVAGDELGSFLNHRFSNLPTLRRDYAERMINEAFRSCLQSMINAVLTVSPDTQIFMHGYGYVKATGKGYEQINITFAGPWILPAFAAKRIFDETEQDTAMRFLIDGYNGLLAQLDAENSNFHYVDLRDMINPDTDWGDELHLRSSGYAQTAKRINERITAVLSQAAI